MQGILEQRYLEARPGATTGIRLCQWFEEHPDQWFTHAEIKEAVRCSDRIIREHVPEVLNAQGQVIDVDKSRRAWRYRYRKPALSDL